MDKPRQQIRSLELEGISKSFGEVRANRGIDFRIDSGEIVGLLGENGAGKTTLMNILFGLYQPDAGEIVVNDKSVHIRSPKDSITLGIGMVHQHFMLVQNHTVAENVALASIDGKRLFPTREVKRRLSKFAESYGLRVDPDKEVWELSAGEQQRVEIAKLLLNSADLLIMDEPTSVLTPAEARDLFEILRRMRAEGHSVIFISHKLEEVIDVCDRVVILRRGEIVGAADTNDVDRRDLARMMVGREVIFDFERSEKEAGRSVLEVDSVTVRGDRGTDAVKDVSFMVRQGEIVGVAGVSGNGQKELIEAITGLRHVEHGRILVEGLEVSNRSARTANNVGVTHVPEERMRFGIVPNLFIYDNSILKRHHQKPFSNLLFLDYREIRGHADKIVDEFHVDAPSIRSRAKELSGGNIQKLILGREISGDHSLLVAAHPTYGLDIGATEFIRHHLLERRLSGTAVLLVSEDLEELRALSDRIAIMYGGEIAGVVSPDTDLDEIGLLMVGSSAQGA